MKQSSCRFCKPPKRHMGCQIECEEYKMWKKEYDEEKKKIEEGREKDRAYLDFIYRRRRK